MILCAVCAGRGGGGYTASIEQGPIVWGAIRRTTCRVVRRAGVTGSHLLAAEREHWGETRPIRKPAQWMKALARADLVNPRSNTVKSWQSSRKAGLWFAGAGGGGGAARGRGGEAGERGGGR